MNRYILNIANMADRASAHDEIARALDLPAHYGRNLDALWDEVSTLRGEISLAGADAPSSYAEQILRLLQEAAEQNPHLSLSKA